MQYLLDTHIILWWLQDPQKIAAPARSIIEEQENELFVSTASFWEMSIKTALGRLTMPPNLREVLTAENIEIISVGPDEALAVASLPMIHNDPFDRMLITQSKLKNMTLITADKLVLKYPVATIRG